MTCGCTERPWLVFSFGALLFWRRPRRVAWWEGQREKHERNRDAFFAARRFRREQYKRARLISMVKERQEEEHEDQRSVSE